MCSVSGHGSLVLSQLHGWAFLGRGVQPSAVHIVGISDQVLKFRRKVLNNNNVFPCCKEEWFGERLGGCFFGLCPSMQNLAKVSELVSLSASVR